jgi:hypothetical protein
LNIPQASAGTETLLLDLICNKRGGMATFLIAYDVHSPAGEAYDQLIVAIKTLGAWWHHLETVWIVKSSHTPADIKDRLRPLVGIDDQLLVVDISGDAAEWLGINESGARWLMDHVCARP